MTEQRNEDMFESDLSSKESSFQEHEKEFSESDCIESESLEIGIENIQVLEKMKKSKIQVKK